MLTCQKSSQKTDQKNLVKMVGSKSTCPKWHFGQVEHDDNWDTFWSIFPIEKVAFSCSKLHLDLGGYNVFKRMCVLDFD